MNLVSIDGIAKRHAEKQVLDGVTLGVDEGDRVGVIGANGSGKSTLLRILAGLTEPDEGRVVTGATVRVELVPQEPALDPDAAILAAVVDGLSPDGPGAGGLSAGGLGAGQDAQTTLERGLELERRARALLQRLGLGDVDRLVGTLSGGQRKRVALARGLAADADVLVLDEPTNQLDVDAIEWLEGVLRGRGGALVLVTHDRYLLDRLATRIVEVVDGGIQSGHGSYANYLEARALREEQAASSERRRRNRARTELAWLRRGAKARSSKARYRVERAHELLDTEAPADQAELRIGMPSRRIGSKVVNLHGAGKRYGDRWVLREVEHRLAPDARVGVVGPNGAGKTTLLALIAGRLEPDAGKVATGETVRVGWYGQDPEPLPGDQRVIDAVDEVARETALVDGVKVGASQLLERFMFPPLAQRGRVGELSGGERRRLELLRVLAEAPNLLLLDEPTNDLDLDTLGVLEEYLDVWPGALVVASHDRYFLDRVCSQVWSVEPDGRIRDHPGGWSAWRRSQADAAKAMQAGPGLTETTSATRFPEAGRSRKRGYAEQREFDGLDRRLRELEQRRVALTEALEASGGDYQVVRAAGEELARVVEALDAAESRWLELAEIGSN